MRILKTKGFDDNVEVVDFVNKNSIDKNDIQQIVANDYHIMLYYWEEEKEYVTTLNDKKLMDYDHYNINRPNHMEL